METKTLPSSTKEREQPRQGRIQMWRRCSVKKIGKLFLKKVDFVPKSTPQYFLTRFARHLNFRNMKSLISTV